MDEEIDVSVAVEQLKEAGSDPARQVHPLLTLADWHLRKCKETANGSDFTKASALYNAALVRSKLSDHEVGEDQIIRGIVETYRAFLSTFANDEDVGVDEIHNEIRSHKEFVAKERKIFKERLEHRDKVFKYKVRNKMKTQVQLILQYQLLHQLALLMHWSMCIPIPSRAVTKVLIEEVAYSYIGVMHT